MRLIWRDAWYWRGGFADHEIGYTPVLADATSSPLDVSATEHWPVLGSPVDAAWAVGRAVPGLRMHELVVVAGLHLALVERSGGYHATVPDGDPWVQARFTGLCGADEDRPDLATALDWMEAARVVSRGPEGVGLLRPPATPATDLAVLRDALDTHAFEADHDPVLRRVAQAWRDQAAGLRRRRYRELARAGRLTATVAVDAPAADDPEHTLEVGRTTLPPVRGGDMVEREHLHPARSLVPLRDVVLDRPDAAGAPLLAADYEVAALMRTGTGPNAMRRIGRAACVWLLLARETGGTVGRVDRSLRSLARDAAAVCGLADGTDFRHQTRRLLGDLERVGCVERTADGGILVLRPPGPTDDAVRETLTELITWRATKDDPLHDSSLPTEHLERHVRDVWATLLEEGRITLAVRAPSATTPRPRRPGPGRATPAPVTLGTSAGH